MTPGLARRDLGPAAQKRRVALVIRTVSDAHATAKLARANRADNVARFLSLETRRAA